MMYAKIIGALLVALVIAGLYGGMKHYQSAAAQERANTAAEKAAKELAVAANAAQEATIGRLRATIAANDKLVADSAAEIKELNDRYATISDQLRELVSKNVEVRDFLDMPVPDALRRLHSKPKTVGGGAKPSDPGARSRLPAN